jgi:hypothetical protein
MTARRSLVFVITAFWLPGFVVAAQTPSPNEVAHCRSILDATAQFACFHALNEKLKRAVNQSPTPTAVPAPASPAPPVAAPAPSPPAPPVPAAEEGIPACPNLSNPQKRLSCYDSKWPPPPVAPTPVLPFNN